MGSITLRTGDGATPPLVTGSLEALLVDDGWAGLVVFSFGDPHGLEGGQGGKDGTTDPDRVFTLWWSDDLHLHGGWGEGGHFLVETFTNTWEHGGTTGEDDVFVEGLADVDIAFLDGSVGELVNTLVFFAVEGWLEEEFWASELLGSEGDDFTVWEFVGDFLAGGGGEGLHFRIIVEGDIGLLLLDVTDNFHFGGGVEGDVRFHKDLGHPVGEVTTSEIDSHDGVGKGVTVEDWDSVGDTITGVEDDTGGTT